MLKTSSSGVYRKDELYEGLLSSIDEAFGTCELSPFYDDPVGFAKHVCGVTPTKDQELILKGIAENGHVAVRSGHGIGKSTAMALVALWWMTTRKDAKIPATAPSSHQLFDVFYGELLGRWRGMKPEYKKQFDATSQKFFHLSNPEGWAVFPRTARPDKPDSLQGFHGENLLFLIDEAAGVANQIFEVAEGALTAKENRVLMCGNPTRLSGFFYDAFHADRRHWHTLHFSSLNSPLVDKSYAKRMGRKYGEGSNIYKVRVQGDFPTSEEDQLISVDLLESAVERDLPAEGKVVWGLDVARFGSDETALCIRVGNLVETIKTRRNMNTMETVGWVAHLVEESTARPKSIIVDTIGIGAGVADRLRELGLPAVDCNVGERSNQPEKYFNLRSELWIKYRDWLVEGNCKLPDDDDLIAQSSTIKYSFTSSGQIKIEKKEDLKKRGLRSPDRADSLCLTFYEPQFLFQNLRLWRK